MHFSKYCLDMSAYRYQTTHDTISIHHNLIDYSVVYMCISYFRQLMISYSFLLEPYYKISFITLQLPERD